MAAEVLINAGVGEIRVALVAEGRLQELTLVRTIGTEENARGCQSLVGTIVLGRVRRVLAGMQAAFVDIGLERAGFLALREAKVLAKAGAADEDDDIRICECLREGEAVLVQIIKDPIAEKGARLTAAITLPGRMLVMTPGQPGLALSRRIEDAGQRACLMALGERMQAEAGSRLVAGAGFIFRTVAVGACFDDLVNDAVGLADIWRDILAMRHTVRPPAPLYRDLGPIERTMRDAVRGDIARVLIDDARAAEAARAYCRKAMPEAEGRITQVNEPVFDLYGLEDEIAALAHPRVVLPSGAWITIENTEAMTVIDVNSGRFIQSTGLEETSLAVNLEAACEIGRQIRLRGIGGLIVVDFIHLAETAHGEQVQAALDESLAFDRAPVQISPMSEFGIVAITRKRVREPLARLLGAPCPACRGEGRMMSRESVALAILRRVEREGRAAPGREIRVRAAPAVVDWLNGQAHEIAPRLAQRGMCRVCFEDGPFEREMFDVQIV